MVGLEVAESLYRTMLSIRRFEETALACRLAGDAFGTMHPYVGQEAIAAGICGALAARDRIVSNHRGHGHLIAKGASMERMFAELLGRVDGYCRGKGGSMHIADYDLGILGANGIVGAGLPIAVGSGVASVVSGDDAVTVAFFGDGATSEGTFHESMNLAALKNLPIIWVCENNQYSDRTMAATILPAGSVHAFGASYGIRAEAVDGTDALQVHEVAEMAIQHARSGNGPVLLECETYRFGVHAQRGVPIAEHRNKAELDSWKGRDPIALILDRLLDDFGLSPSYTGAIAAEINTLVAEALRRAEGSPFPDLVDALTGA